MPEISVSPLPAGDLPGKMPTVPPTDYWTGVKLATVSVTDTVTGEPITNETHHMHLAALGQCSDPSIVNNRSEDVNLYARPLPSGQGHFNGRLWKPLGTSFPDALRSAAEISFQNADVGIDPLIGHVASSTAIGLLQATDGTYYATHLTFDAPDFRLPKVGTPLVDQYTQHPLSVSISRTEQGSALQAVVFADQYVDLRDRAAN